MLPPGLSPKELLALDSCIEVLLHWVHTASSWIDTLIIRCNIKPIGFQTSQESVFSVLNIRAMVTHAGLEAGAFVLACRRPALCPVPMWLFLDHVIGPQGEADRP